MEQKVIRELRADEIECRIGTISEKGLSLLLYKDARADMKILDEVYGAMNWQRKHEVIGGNLYCTVSVWDTEKQQWIGKMDVGTESYTEKEKGQASDAFKRACVSHGIGRELYTAPFIWVGASKCKIEKKDNKFVCYDKFKITGISYTENREIKTLTIINQDGKVVYDLKEKGTVGQTPTNQNSSEPQQPEQGASDEKIVALNKELVRTGVALDAVLERYGVASVHDMNEATYKKAMSSLKKTKTKAA